jgi:hypothetical protein
MRKSLLSLKQCSFCGFDLNIKKTLEDEAEGLINSIVGCQCGRFPIIDGIVYLKSTSLEEKVVDLPAAGSVGQSQKIPAGKSSETMYLLPKILKSNQSCLSLIVRSALY